LNALAIIVLLVTGLALGGYFADQLVALLGGHLLVNTMHSMLGLAFAVALVLLVLLLPAKVKWLLQAALYFRRNELRWPLDFLRFYLRPGRHVAPFHDGFFDPAQRVIFIGLIAAVT